MTEAPPGPDWPPDASHDLRKLMARLRRRGIDVLDVGVAPIGGWDEVAGVELPGFTARLDRAPGGHWPGFTLNVRHHPFRRLWLLQTQPDTPGLGGRLPDPVSFQLLRNGARNDARRGARRRAARSHTQMWPTI